jgi:RNA polymerase sigma-70 factor, ECF subfamily
VNVAATITSITTAKTRKIVNQAATKLASAADSGLETLFREHHALIFRAAYRITNSAADAEDVLQTVFLRLMRGEEKLNLAPNPAGYLHRAAVNAALDLVRSRARSSSVALDEIDPALFESKEVNPEALAQSGELRQFLARRVSQMGERTAEIFAMRYFEGYDNHEIARITGTTQMVVAVVLHRARTRLRRELGEFLEGHNETH